MTPRHFGSLALFCFVLFAGFVAIYHFFGFWPAEFYGSGIFVSSCVGLIFQKEKTTR